MDAAFLNMGKAIATELERTVVAVSPHDLFRRSDPVTDLTARVGQQVQFPIVGVIVDPDTIITPLPGGGTIVPGGYYTNKRSKQVDGVVSSCTISAESLPPGAIQPSIRILATGL